MFKFLEGGMVEITASYPAGVIGNTLENLRAAAAGEHEEWSLDYPHFADVAEQEGFPMIAAMYRNAVTAVISKSVRKLPKFARHVCIRRRISRLRKKTINKRCLLDNKNGACNHMQAPFY